MVLFFSIVAGAGGGEILQILLAISCVIFRFAAIRPCPCPCSSLAFETSGVNCGGHCVRIIVQWILGAQYGGIRDSCVGEAATPHIYLWSN